MLEALCLLLHVSTHLCYWLLRTLLVEAGFAPYVAAKFTSHSLKATSLSWAAKAGLPMSARRPLGGHCKKDEAAPARPWSRRRLPALKSLTGQPRKVK